MDEVTRALFVGALLVWGLSHVVPTDRRPLAGMPRGPRSGGAGRGRGGAMPGAAGRGGVGLGGAGPGDARRDGTWPRARFLPRLGRAPVVDVGELLTEVATRLRSGTPASAAWDEAARRAGLPGGTGDDGMPAAFSALPGGPVTAGAVAAWRLASELGAPLADILDDCALAITHAEENEAARAVALAGPVASARMLGALPVGGVLLGTALGAEPLAQLLGGGLGTLAGLAGAALYAVGLRWSGRFVNAAKGAEA
nr:hypothetical protein [Actinomycetales bacterium]